VIRRVALAVSAVIALVVSALSGPAWAHPEVDSPRPSAHARADRPDQPEHAALPAHRAGTPPNQGPSAIAVAAGALALLASLPNRRRTLGLALALAVSAAALEGMTHAALHVGHVGHADGLAIDASAIPPGLVDLHPEPPGRVALVRRGEVPQRPDAPVADAALAAARQRAPPASAAS
jgi:hypothetical protein